MAAATELTRYDDAPLASVIEDVIAKGDLAKLSPDQRAAYYVSVCDSMGINALTQPLAYITLNGKLTLYAGRGCTDQLRKAHGVSTRIVSRERQEDLYVVVAQATDPSGRTDESLAAVPLAGLKGEALANAFMKCETKAKRRATLALVGLSLLDETEVVTVPSAVPAQVDTRTGEIIDGRTERIDGDTLAAVLAELQTYHEASDWTEIEHTWESTKRTAGDLLGEARRVGDSDAWNVLRDASKAAADHVKALKAAAAEPAEEPEEAMGQ